MARVLLKVTRRPRRRDAMTTVSTPIGRRRLFVPRTTIPELGARARRMKSATLCVAALAVASCDGARDAPDASSGRPSLAQQGKEAFWDAFLNDRYEDLAASRDLLMRAYEENPKDAANTHQVYNAWFWTTGEIDRADPPLTPQQIGASWDSFLRFIQEGRELNPDDARYDGWLGATLVIGGLDQRSADLVQQGRALLGAGTERWPAFGQFMTVVAFERQPVTSPEWAEALEAMWATVDTCVGAKIDRENPDITPYLHKQGEQGLNSACWSTPGVPHGQEGLYLFFGDVLVKEGEVDAAEVMFRNARLTESYSTWRDRPIVEERLASDLAMRSALYRDDDPNNDPPVKTALFCTGCHSH
ncbi:hypothetical protein WME79_08325 [Sorangium sp. So ce726]|uniref:hypothetical protein n=1 Tax=Sorangium sp. So ce726 TaxID=3133319 RepID=UPI003F5E35D5